MFPVRSVRINPAANKVIEENNAYLSSLSSRKSINALIAEIKIITGKTNREGFANSKLLSRNNIIPIKKTELPMNKTFFCFFPKDE